MYILNFFASVNLHSDSDLFYGRNKLMHLEIVLHYGLVEINTLGFDNKARLSYIVPFSTYQIYLKIIFTNFI